VIIANFAKYVFEFKLVS